MGLRTGSRPRMLQLKSLRIDPPVVQAPMCGCSDLPYRRIVRRFGCALAFAEMVKDRAVIDGNRKTRELLSSDANDRPLGGQLAGRDPELLAEAARRLESLGVAVIDLNAGCPVPKVVRAGCGAALLREPALIGHLVERMARAVSVPVTVKFRTAFDTEDNDRLLEIARLAESAGAAALTVHGRTRAQGFSGEPNLDAIRRVKARSGIPIIGNGNIRCGQDALRMMRETGCDAVMVARGALGNPWIFRSIQAALAGAPEPPAPSPAERAAVLADHFEGLCDAYGTERALHRIRRVIPWYVRGVDRSCELRRAGSQLESVSQFRDLIAGLSSAIPRADVRGMIPEPSRDRNGPP